MMFEAYLNNIYNIFEDEPHISVPLYDEFKPPIDYLNEDSYTLNENVVADLEIDTSVDISSNHNSTNTMYDYLCNPHNQFMKHNILKNKKYTTNVEFLENQQSTIKNMDNLIIFSDICCNHF